MIQRCPQLLVLMVALALPVRQAAAHPRLTKAAPAAESHLQSLPGEVALTFNEGVSVALSRLTLFDANRQPVLLGTLRAAAGATKTLVAKITGKLVAGRYTVKWQAAGADGHPTRGEYSFVIDAGAAGLSIGSSGPPAVADDLAFGVESPAYAAIRAVQSVAIVALIGVLALQLVVLPRFARQATAGAATAAAAGRRALPIATWATAAFGAATIARLVAQHAAMFGVQEPWTRTTMGALLFQSGWGLAWWLAVAGTAAGFWALGRIRAARAFGWPALAGAALALSVSLAMSGHSAAAGRPVLAIAVHALHVIGAGGWVGSLAMLMLAAVPAALSSSSVEGHADVSRLVAAFSPTALAFASLIVVTGVIAAWRNIGSFDGLLHSTYGQLLMVKLAVLGVAAGTGAYNWKRVLPILGNATATRRLRGSAAVELGAALVVLAITAVLVATPMPADAMGAMGR